MGSPGAELCTPVLKGQRLPLMCHKGVPVCVRFGGTQCWEMCPAVSHVSIFPSPVRSRDDVGTFARHRALRDPHVGGQQRGGVTAVSPG